MSMIAECFAQAALSLSGTPFRLHGRSPEHGVDCVGLVVCALARCGLRVTIPAGYRLRNTDIARYLALAERNGFREGQGGVRRGDLLLLRPGPAQHHLVVATGRDAGIHAHAGLRRVVAGPLPAEWLLLQHWRLDSIQGN